MLTEAEECKILDDHKKVAHDFGQAQKSKAQTTTLIVAIINIFTMLAEIIIGYLTGSMALFADGVHMGGHALALGLASFAYYLTYKNSNNRSYSLGSGKINELAAFVSGLILFIAILWLVYESITRLLNPEIIMAKEALLVAVIGLIINLISVLILNQSDAQKQLELVETHTHAHAHAHAHAAHEEKHHNNKHEHAQASHSASKDNNLQAALVHVLMDALTSLAAILGLVIAWLWDIYWIDAIIALVASFWILKWSIGLLRQTTGVLLDKEASKDKREEIIAELEKIDGTKVVDLHLWSVGRNSWTAIVILISHQHLTPEIYKKQLSKLDYVYHPIIEIHPCSECSAKVL